MASERDSMTMDPQLCRDQLRGLLQEELQLLDQLEQLLVSEHEVLLQNEITALEAASAARQLRMAELLKIQDERRATLTLHGFPGDSSGIETALQWCDPTQTLKQRWAECLIVAQRCRTANERNAALVAARMRRVGGLLDVIVAPHQRSSVYSATGTRATAEHGLRFAAEA